MFLNYAEAGAYINIGGVNAENRAEVSLNEEKIKKVLTKYAQLKDAFGIDRNTVSLKECADLFSTGNMLYTVVDADSLSVRINYCHRSNRHCLRIKVISH